MKTAVGAFENGDGRACLNPEAYRQTRFALDQLEAAAEGVRHAHATTAEADQIAVLRAQTIKTLCIAIRSKGFCDTCMMREDCQIRMVADGEQLPATLTSPPLPIPIINDI